MKKKQEKVNSTKDYITLIKLRNKGHLEGFYGRLGNLGAIDEKYDIAVSTGCPNLNYFVIEDIDAAERCYDNTRDIPLGHIKLMILKDIKSDVRPIQTPENVPRLFDLIEPKEDRFAPIFYKLCGDTLVANDLQQAIRIAHGEGGEVIDTFLSPFVAKFSDFLFSELFVFEDRTMNSFPNNGPVDYKNKHLLERVKHDALRTFLRMRRTVHSDLSGKLVVQDFTANGYRVFDLRFYRNNPYIEIEEIEYFPGNSWANLNENGSDSDCLDANEEQEKMFLINNQQSQDSCIE
ncbi:SMCs flexible hinge [Glomus cerebriforme]|uniref:SMCs flexible hinge n=1 Tax=Glomus cerebriforme TaxID=658196 RepID=A0A397SW86_9GLOM|nr:SMCs flexible hinge [Glomus cerebriforme]